MSSKLKNDVVYPHILEAEAENVKRKSTKVVKIKMIRLLGG